MDLAKSELIQKVLIKGRGAEISSKFQPVLWIRIRIHMFLGLPDPDPLVRCMDPDPASDPDPSVIMQK